MHTKDLGDLSEAKVLSRIKELGFYVSVPFGDNLPYDMVVDSEDGELYRIQVKTGRYDNGCVLFETRSSNSNMNESWHNDYQGEADFFCVYNQETDDVYAIRVSECGTSSTRLRVEEPESTGGGSINWAEDYLMTTETFK